MTYRLAASLSLLSLSIPAVAAVPAVEPESSILRKGRDLEWHQPADANHPHTAEQRAFQEWMRTQYRAWRQQWREPENIQNFARENRQIRRQLTQLHRRAVRTGDWSIPLLPETTPDSIQSRVPGTFRATHRKSARLIRREARQLVQQQLSRIR